MIKFNSLKFKLTLFVLTMLMISIFSVAAVSITSFEKGVKEDKIQNSALANSLIDENISTFLNNAKASVSILGSSEQVQALDFPAMMRIFEQTRKENGFLYTYMGTIDGKMIDPAEDVDPNYDPRTRDWYKDAIEKGEMIVSDVYPDIVTKESCITISMPVKDKNGKILGVLGVDLTLNKLGEFTKKHKLGNTGYFYVVCNGKIIVHPDSKKLNMDLSKRPFVIDAMAGKQGLTEYVNSDGNNMAIYYSKMKSTGWVIITQQMVSEAYGQVYSTINKVILISIIIGILISLLTMWLIKKQIKQIDFLEKGAKLIADGDMRNSIAKLSNDEMGSLTEAINLMISNLKQMIEKIRDSANTLNGTSKSLDNYSLNIQRSVHKRTEEITQIAATVEQISASSQEVTASSIEMTNYTKGGKEKIQEAVYAMNNITQSTNKISEAVNNINQKGQEIGRIIDIITKIADQTNLLALNAAIEAARAGEHGRGFAVVAEEVRKLSDETTLASQNITQLVHDIQQSTNSAIVLVEENTSKVEIGDLSISETGVLLDNIFNVIVTLNEQFQQTNDATQAMAGSVQHVASMSQEQLAVIEDMQAMVNKLSLMAEDLKVSVQAFKL